MPFSAKSFTAALLFLVCTTPPAAAHAEPVEGAIVMTDAELRAARGGFAWSGMEVSFGAEIRTYLGGVLALQTTISWTPGGAATTQAVFAGLTPAGADEVRAGILTSGGITMRVGENSVFLANEGRTALMHRTDGAIQNVLLNTASNITASQEIDAVLSLGGYAAFAADNRINQIGSSLSRMVSEASSFALRH